MFSKHVKNLNTQEFKLSMRAFAELMVGRVTNPEIKRFKIKKKLISEYGLNDWILSGNGWKLTISVVDSVNTSTTVMPDAYPDGWTMAVYPAKIENSMTPYRPAFFMRSIATAYVSNYDAWLRDMSLIVLFDKPNPSHAKLMDTVFYGYTKSPPTEGN